MNLRHLETFVAVADTASFSRAADRLHVVQSAVSAGIRTLEQDLGTELFRRTARGAVLTDAGTALLPEARATLAAAAAARDAVDEVRGGLRGTVHLGIMQTMRAPAPNPAALLATFAHTHPLVDVQVRHGGGSLQMAEQVRDGRLDLAFISAQDSQAGLQLTALSTQPVDLVCGTAHRLAGRASVTLAELAEEPFVDLPLLWGTRTVNDAAFAAAGLTRRVAYEINETSMLAEFIRAGLAVGLLPKSLVVDTSGLAFVPLRRSTLAFQVSIAAPGARRLSASARALHDHILATALG
ncbi:MAG: LysR family transcriptional regulator [Solirubrobacteraceae bacterium]|nr:LysR family transcriptional regulator [Solirubrobacteraceae bacterium]